MVPALKAAANPLSTGLKIVSALPHLPAKIVSFTSNVVKDMGKAVEIVYKGAVEAAGPVLETVSNAARAASELNWTEISEKVGNFTLGVTLGIQTIFVGPVLMIPGVKDKIAEAGGLDADSGAFKAGELVSDLITMIGPGGAAKGGVKGGIKGLGWLSKCFRNSFAPGTAVLLANGTQKAIEKIKVGDRVLATDPPPAGRRPAR
ncbi:hypothetical protein OHR68_08150 [Spirillospora sp. NBC_00431]